MSLESKKFDFRNAISRITRILDDDFASDETPDEETSPSPEPAKPHNDRAGDGRSIQFTQPESKSHARDSLTSNYDIASELGEEYTFEDGEEIDNRSGDDDHATSELPTDLADFGGDGAETAIVFDYVPDEVTPADDKSPDHYSWEPWQDSSLSDARELKTDLDFETDDYSDLHTFEGDIDSTADDAEDPVEETHAAHATRLADSAADSSTTEYEDEIEQEAEALEPEVEEEETGSYEESDLEALDAEHAEMYASLNVKDRVVVRLLSRDVVTMEQVEHAWEEWARMQEEGYKIALWRVLTLDPNVNRDQVYLEAARVYAFTEDELDVFDALAFIEKTFERFDQKQFERMIELFVVPVKHDKNDRGERRWIFVTHDPTRPEVHKLLQQLNLKRFELRYAPEALVGEIITEAFLTKNEYLDRLNEDPLVYDLGMSFEEKKGLVNEEELDNEINRSSLINLFEATLVEAVNTGASDIHIFPNPEGQIEIHFRVDGELVKWHTEERIHPESFLAVVKDNSINVDRFEKDSAQDGFAQRLINDVVIRFRISILPVASHKSHINAESIVIRVLDDRKVLTDLTKIGLLDQSFDQFMKAVRQPQGMVILTGPTGSGKSTTLVAALHQVITTKVNVLTVEDPVEYLIKGVRQIKLSHKLDLEGALRAILRHDPDIVMVGEMRDRATAELAIKLSNTGHLTFSTLHTNDAASAVSRLYKMGIEPFLIAYAINIVVAQRLIRKLCSECKSIEKPDVDLLNVLGFSADDVSQSEFYGAGEDRSCRVCGGTGYSGRRAIAETLFFSPAIRRIILTAGEMIDEDLIKSKAVEEGMLTLRQSAREIVKLGETSVAEMIRVTGMSD